MIKTVSAINWGDTPMNINIEIKLPSQCPHCQVAYADQPMISYLISSESFFDTEEENLYSLYFCPHCEQCFFVHYRVLDSDPSEFCADIEEIFPNPQSCTKFPDKISTLSPQFVKIYSQAEKAELSGLSEICGLGYRKSLEFLIKDFSIHEHPESVEAIKSAPLSQCIKKYISSDKIKTLAERSAWIGNDEAHYVRKQEGYNTSNMKSFIEACIYFIAMTLVSEEASAMTPK